MNELSNLTPAPGAVRKKKRVGRGESSRWGKRLALDIKGKKPVVVTQSGLRF